MKGANTNFYPTVFEDQLSQEEAIKRCNDFRNQFGGLGIVIEPYQMWRVVSYDKEAETLIKFAASEVEKV